MTAAAPEPIGTDARGRPILMLRVARLADVPASLGLPRPWFLMLVAMDATRETHEARDAFAAAAIDDGCAYMSAWGTESTWLDDDFDMVRVIRSIENDDVASDPEPPVVTTWHHGVPIEEAVGFWLECADPNSYGDPHPLPDAEQCLVAVVVGDRAWADAIRRDVARRLAAPPQGGVAADGAR